MQVADFDRAEQDISPKLGRLKQGGPVRLNTGNRVRTCLVPFGLPGVLVEAPGFRLQACFGFQNVGCRALALVVGWIGLKLKVECSA